MGLPPLDPAPSRTAPATVPDLTAAGRLLHAIALGPEDAEDGSFPRLPGYTITRRLGGGGGGEVYQGFRDGSDCPRAIKILTRRFDADLDTRAWRELDLLAQLRVPATPRLLDYGLHAGRPYIVSEFIAGMGLADHCDINRLGRRQRVALLARIADALHTLHEHGVIHRDLKPSNIIIDPHGDPFIIDLGLATPVDGDPLHTMTVDGTVAGSPAYMAPEQARGERGRISTRTDIYNLGATAYHVLTGSTPHTKEKRGPGASPGPDDAPPPDPPLPSSRSAHPPASTPHVPMHEAIRRAAQDEPQDPRRLDPTLPRALAAVLLKAVARDPAYRYPSAAAFAADLRRWLSGEPVEAQPPGPYRRATRWLARRPAMATASACALFVLGTLALTKLSVWWINERPARVVWDWQNRGTAELRTRSGRVLRTWGSGPETVFLAARLDRPEALGGGRVVVIHRAELPDWGWRVLEFYGIDAYDRPYFTTETAPLRMPPHPLHPDRTDQAFMPTTPLVADVFPQSPGDELVVIFAAQHSQRAIRVFRLDGTVLFEAWHEGGASCPIWMPASGQLVMSGDNQEYSTTELGLHHVRYEAPKVVFAIRPDLGGIHGWLNGDWSRPEDRAVIAWYRCILPPEAWDLLNERLYPPALETARRGRFVHIDFLLKGTTNTFGYLIDEQGELLGDPVISSGYRRECMGVFDPYSLRLGELPRPPKP